MELLSNISKRMKENKKFSVAVFALIAVGGMLILSNLFGSGDTKNDGYITMQGAEQSVSYTEVEIKLEKILSTMDGAGKVNVMVSTVKENGDERICGVIVTAQGARDIGVKLKLHNAVCTVLELEDEKVEIFEMSEVEINEEE